MNKIAWVMPIIIFVIVAIPFITHNQTYHTLVTAHDGLVHTKVIEDYRHGAIPNILYPAQAIFGKVLSFLAVLFNVRSQFVFLIFMALSLFLSLWVIYWITKELVGIEAGFFAVLLGSYRINAVLEMFVSSQVFNLIDMYIVLPLAVYFLVKWLASRRKRYLWFGLIGIAIFSYLHPVAIYIPYMCLVFMVLSAIRKDEPIYMITTLAVLAVNLVVSLPLNHQIVKLTQDIPSMVQHPDYMTNLYYLTMIDLTPLVICMGVFVAIVWSFNFKQIIVTKEQLCLMIILAIASLVIICAGMVGSSLAPDRQLRDGAILLGVLISVATGILWQNKKLASFVVMPTMLLTGINVINTSVGWFK